MVDILHRIGATGTSPEEVYAALTTTEGLSAWWTEDTTGSAAVVGGVIEFRFLPGGFDMEVVDLRPAGKVVWRVVHGPDEWVGTTIEWELRQDGDFTIVLFAHRNWTQPVEFMAHCSTKWAIFLMSLKALVETGAGAPAPNDMQISDWH
jgi:uncharacterized protein YndB with AHSA1/START domain